MSTERLNKDFKRKGEISFNNFDFNYFADGPLVLQSMNFNIEPGEKIGIGKLTSYKGIKGVGRFYCLFDNKRIISWSISNIRVKRGLKLLLFSLNYLDITHI